MTLMMPIAVGSNIATVAVLETNADSRQVIAPNARITPVVDRPTPGRLRIQNANRRATPCLSIAAARMNAPMNVKIVDDPNGAEHVVDRCDPEEHRDGDAEQTADRDRHRLADPQRDDAEQHRGEHLLLARNVDREHQEDDGQQRREEEADGAPALLEAFLLR